MASGSTDEEFLVLTTEAGLTLLAEVASVAEPRPADLDRWRKSAPIGWVSAAIRLAGSRKKGIAKFSRADAMWLDPTGLEQATAEVVARHKATRFGDALVIDLCSGIGGDAIAFAAAAKGVIAVDRDTGMARRSRWNARVYGVEDCFLSVVGDAANFPIPGGALVQIDPDRRANRRTRARSIEGYEPGIDFLRRLPSMARGGSIKLGPASDFSDHFGDPGFEIELVSLGGECKEANAWFGDLATCRRRATTLPNLVSWTDLDGPIDALLGHGRPLAWLFDPDPAMIRSGLLAGFARSLGLVRIAPGIDFLTGPERIDSPFLTPFEVIEVLPLDLKQLRRVIADRKIGRLEIKTRGLDLRPEIVRARLRPQGEESASLLLHGGPEGAGAILARRV